MCRYLCRGVGGECSFRTPPSGDGTQFQPQKTDLLRFFMIHEYNWAITAIQEAPPLMKILSHRGSFRGADINENTHAAFERALALGVDGIETDIRLSAEGEPVLFHDRLAPDGRPVAALSRRELEKTAGYEIPTLDEVLARWPNVFWNLEIKCPAAVPMTIDLLQRHPRTEKILVSSFRHDIVAQCAGLVDVTGGLILASAPVDVAKEFEPWKAFPQVRTVVWDFNVLDAELVAQTKKCGFRVFAYGMVTAAEHRECREWGLDGMITDFPEREIGNSWDDCEPAA